MTGRGRLWPARALVVGGFSVAMGFLEAAVVVYLRLHYYPEGFSFPPVVIPETILMIEVAREAATIVMLAALAWLAGARFLTRFAYFALAFGVWDILYYVFLWVTVGWPATLMTPDILFLIPVPWTAPVLAPVVVSVCLIGGAWVVLWRESRERPLAVTGVQWTVMILGGALILVSFMMNAEPLLRMQEPGPFLWWVFAGGMLLGVGGFVSAVRRG